jgi:hypothetical protein
MEKQTIKKDLINYINSFEITKVSFGKLYIKDQLGNLVVEVSSRGKNAFVHKSFFYKFNTNESELLTLLKDKFNHKTINSVIFI